MSAAALPDRPRGLRLLFLPILRYEEGYGVSYGVRLARTDLLGPKSRVSVPLTWGGERRAALEAHPLDWTLYEQFAKVSSSAASAPG